MPRLDETGPEGKGPLTGRRMGRCAQDEKGERNEDTGRPALGLGKGGRPRGGGRGFGGGRRARFFHNRSEVDE